MTVLSLFIILVSFGASSSWASSANEFGAPDIMIEGVPTAVVPLKDTKPSFEDLLGIVRADHEEARGLALQILSRADARAVNRLFQSVYRKLAGAVLMVPREGYDFTKCSDAVMGYVAPGLEPNKIFICDLALNSGRQAIAQVLIHETAHLLGLRNECDAHAVATLAFQLTGEPFGYHSQYEDSCR